LRIEHDVRTRFPGTNVLVRRVNDITVEKVNTELEALKEKLIEETKNKFNAESLKDVPVFRLYRDFFWRLGIDPTKNRPAAEALVRRILVGKPIPSVNSVVEAYNLASVKTLVALAVFDADKLSGELTLRFAKVGEEFMGIGMDKPLHLSGDEVVVSDAEKLVAVYPYRDAEASKVTRETKNVVILVCGVPGISEETLLKASHTATKYITEFCGGEEMIE